MALWLGNDGLVLEYGGDALSRYDVSFSSGETHLEAVTNPRLLATRYRTPQLKLFALDDVLGEDGWLKALRLDGYALRSRGTPEMLQHALFSYLEALVATPLRAARFATRLPASLPSSVV